MTHDTFLLFTHVGWVITKIIVMLLPPVFEIIHIFLLQLRPIPEGTLLGYNATFTIIHSRVEALVNDHLIAHPETYLGYYNMTKFRVNECK